MRWSALALLVASSAFGQPKAPVDRYGDALPAGAVGRLGTVRFRLGGSPNAFAISPDGQRGLTADSNSAIVTFDAATGRRLITTPRLKDTYYYSLTFSPDCTRLATADQNGTVHLLDSSNGNEVRQFKGGQNGMNCLAFS